MLLVEQYFFIKASTSNEKNKSRRGGLYVVCQLTFGLNNSLNLSISPTLYYPLLVHPPICLLLATREGGSSNYHNLLKIG